ncbi:MAG: Glycosyl transferase family 2 domain-containing protein [Parcubacteria group bacterium GW2011_GWC1_40_13]|nr:MAG: Glycosyl transferase family 2 domain-containing protein [Parcubacteria group bacterium GW2011_GWC1_40_13]
MKVFIDLGAYDGDTIEKALKLYSDFDFFYAFEPYLPNLEKLRQKFKGNKKIIIFDKAAATHDGKANFFLHKDIGKRKDADEGSTLEKTKNNIDVSNSIEVDTVDFSKFILENFKDSDEIILKIDIEGSEYDLLEKMIADKSIKYMSKLYCEWHKHKTDITEERHISLIKKLNQLGFHLTGKNENDEFSKTEEVSEFSVVIATFNRKNVVKELLDSLRQQTDKNFEVIVAVDGSSDGTQEMLEEYKKTSPFELRWLDTGIINEYGLAVARNMGIKEARGEAIVILDDDSFPVPEFVAEHKKTVAPITLTGGGRISTDPNDNELKNKMRAYLETYGDSIPQKFKPIPKYKWVVENNTCMYKKDWLSSGLFDESIRTYGRIGQTFNRALIKKGFRYQFNPRATIVHHVEYKQNKIYDKEKDESFKTPIGLINGNRIRVFLIKKFPFVYNLLKKIKHRIQYR